TPPVCPANWPLTSTLRPHADTANPEITRLWTTDGTETDRGMLGDQPLLPTRPTPLNYYALTYNWIVRHAAPRVSSQPTLLSRSTAVVMPATASGSHSIGSSTGWACLTLSFRVMILLPRAASTVSWSRRLSTA